MPHKLLLADDSVTIQRVIELTFADEDVQVVAVGDGKKAIASIEADRPDIVLADVGMPERDGYEVAAFIKGNPRLADIPVLLLTGAFEPIDEARARAVGCDGVLVKPFEPQMVINRVKDLLAGRHPAGLWSANPAAQGPTRQPPPAEKFNLRAVASQAAAPQATGSLEDYFDRLDAAFANLDGTPEVHVAPAAPATHPPAGRSVDFESEHAPPASSGLPADILDGWDPELTGDPKRVVPIGARSAPPPVHVPPAASAPPPPSTFAPAAHPAPVAQNPPAPPVSVPSPADVPTPAPSPTSTPAAVAAGPPMPSLAEAFAALLSAEQSHAIAPSALGASSMSDDAVDEIVHRVIARLGDQVVRETVLDVAERLVREEIERIKGS
jgi:CheY-like chemotaxis protein